MNSRTSRRRFLKGAVLGGAGCLVVEHSRAALGYQANEKLNIALVGLGNRGNYHFQTVPRIGQNLVAVCDANRQRMAGALKQRPNVPQYQDFRKMLDELDRRIDALIVATPEHTHAVISAAAMKRGKHVFCEKPIAHDVSEARRLRQIAQQQKVATQMGNQGMATDCFRRTLELIEAGAVGEIREVHAWYVFGGSGPLRRPTESPAVPEHVDWDLWLGPAPFRPYHPSYLTGWGAWRDFSTACLGGGGSHSMNLAFKALKLRALWDGGAGAKGTIRVEAETSERCTENFPRWEIVHFDVPARGPLPPARIHWHNAPEAELRRLGVWERLEKIAGRSLEWKESWTPRSGTLLVGSKGVVHTNAHNSLCTLLPEKDFPNSAGPPEKLPHAGSHEREWLLACRGGPAALSSFDHSGPLMELLLLGNIATLLGQPLEFDPAAGKIAGNPQADRALRCEYRAGWSL